MFSLPALWCACKNHFLLLLQAVRMETRVKEYFESLPSKLIRTGHIESLFQRLRAFSPAEGQAGFKQTELMNIANLRPTSLVGSHHIPDQNDTL